VKTYADGNRPSYPRSTSGLQGAGWRETVRTTMRSEAIPRCSIRHRAGRRPNGLLSVHTEKEPLVHVKPEAGYYAVSGTGCVQGDVFHLHHGFITGSFMEALGAAGRAVGLEPPTRTESIPSERASGQAAQGPARLP